jgi:hypothetical protein
MFYFLFKPVNRRIALIALVFVIICCGLQALAGIFYVVPLMLIKGVHILNEPGLQSSVNMLLNLNAAAFEADLVFFGLWCMVSGWLIYKSTFMPKLFGILLMIDGLGWFLFILPPLAHRLFIFIAIASGVGEIPLMIYLLVVGLKPERWEEQAKLAES